MEIQIDVSKLRILASLQFVVMCLALSNPGMAAETSSPEAAPPAERLPVEVIVAQPLSFKALNNLMRQAEMRMFDLFNELKEEEQYTITCYRERRTGTKIAQRVCAPNFARKASSLNAQAFLADMAGNAAVRSAPVAAEIDFHRPILERRMEEMARDNVEFLEAMIEYYELKMQVDQRQQGQTR
jgi:hypothetical protein